MMSIDQERLGLAGTREFTRPGAGAARRERLAAYNLDLMRELWADATAQVRVPGDGVALAVVGSVARRDGGPLSDYDLVLVHATRSFGGKKLDALADALWYPLWDKGIRLDHSIRTPKECRAVASDDLAAAVGLLDIEPVAGDELLVAQVRQSIAHDWRANARKRLPELVESLRVRHERHGGLANDLEPDLKEAAGGLRDMAVLRSLAAAWLADRPHGAVDAAYDRLLDVRDALHVVTGRGRDRLARQDQDAVAALLGEPDSDALLTSVVQAGRVISHALDDTVRRAGQSQRARALRTGPRRPILRPLGHGLYLHDGEVVLGSREMHQRGALVLLRAATAAASREVPIGPSTLRNLTGELPSIPAPWPAELRDAFVDLLASGPGLVRVWETLDLAGVIGAWLPEWSAVRGRPQRSPVHRHTVDRHLIETVVQAAALRDRVRRPDLLLIAALLHDIGKIAGVHDHAVEGAPVAVNIARRMGFDTADVEVLELLVREHLALVDLATRRDPHDPQTTKALVTAVEERPDVLELLAALTEADAIGAGPKAWTSWRAGLVRSLVEHARSALGERSMPVAGEDAVLDPVVVQRVALRAPYIVVNGTSSGATIEIADRDRPGLFAASARLLASFGMTVRSARVRTTDGIAHNTWQVEAPLADLPDAEQLVRGFQEPGRSSRRQPRVIPEGRRVGMPPSRATVVPDASADALVLEVRAADRPGLLGDLGDAFATQGLAIRSAHVATYAGQSLDTFYLTPAAVTPPDVARIIGALIDACDGAPPRAG
ncbi:[protein-PII] uridylyltransferase [Flexivirga oryzae]|uniref:Bifunctional uridylyltransferase/uridylyl-removing enzyme n=1 Tax=Flexivirga oryzae TaxID=1794944 RepID=A0A839N8W2_9MICO|nr:[protein-PII] uridylyltransferase [Flexivirga oryzae]MBB2892444.1 [protein-PII] uridylyltransferase [Flexivirga oryzae]